MTYLGSADITGRRGSTLTSPTVVTASSGGWVNPTPGGPRPGSGGLFGDPRDNGARLHQGVDLGTGLGAGYQVRAAAAGTVHWSWSRNGGWIVQIDHGGGWVTKYMHLGTTPNAGFVERPGKEGGTVNPYAVADGQRVAAGQVIGYMGDTGNPSAGAYHLHFEMWYKGAPVDPLTTGVLDGTTNLLQVDQSVASTAGRTRAGVARETLGAFLDSISSAVAGGNRLTYGDVTARRQEQQARAGPLDEEQVGGGY